MNINMLMQQAQRMQKEVESNIKKAKEELAQTEVHADMIEDLIAAAMNDAARQAEAISEEKMKSANSGMGLPPGLAGLF